MDLAGVDNQMMWTQGSEGPGDVWGCGGGSPQKQLEEEILVGAHSELLVRQ